MKKVLLVHPYKHHSYYSFLGIRAFSSDSKAFYGYYNKGDFWDKIVSKTSFQPKLCGYSLENIEDRAIITETKIKCEFLLAKFCSKYTDNYLKSFDRAASGYVLKTDILHVLQDYCNITIRKAYKQNIPVVYEQIQPFDDEQAIWLKREVENAGFPNTYVSNRFPQWKLEAQRENLEMATAIIAASKTTEKSLKSVTSKKIYTFPYGADVSICDEMQMQNINNRRLTAKKIKVLYIGAINLLKGVRYVIQAAKKLEREAFEFTFIGEPTYEEDRRLIEQIISLTNCKYIRNIPHSEINTVYRNHDVFVFQGLCEGFGMVSLEAMSNGLPCLLSEGGRGIISENIDGFINPNCNTEILVENLWKLESNRKLLNRMGENARKHVLNYTWQRFSDNIKSVYQNEFG